MKRSLKLLVLVLAVGQLTWSCKEELKPSESKNYISGNFQNITGTEQILLQKLSTREIITIDTIVPDLDGNFEIAPNIDELGFYRVFVSNNNFFNIITQPAETLKLSANIDDLEGSYSVSGSEESEVLTSFNNMMNDYVEIMDSLRMEIQNAQASQNIPKGQAAYDAQLRLNSEVGNKIREFIRANSNKLAVLSALQQFDPEQDLEIFELVIRDLEPVAGDNEIFVQIKQRVELSKRLMPGAVLPDMVSKDFNGQNVRLSETLGEQYTLVDFWAAWCKPCRAENPVVVRAYKKYHGQGFEIYGVSLDKDASQWKAAVEKDGLLWPQVSDLLFWDSPSAKQYNIRSIPMNFLIDSEMRIVAKNLRGAELEAKLGELIGG